MHTVRTRRGRRWLAALAVALGCVAAGLNQPANARQDPGKDDQPGPEVLNRGAIHEAFANPITYDPTPGPVVPRQPSDPIEEQPPDQKPEGDAVQWISGYWSWDEERADFIWISGIWREPPPNCQWTPGYWNQCDGGWRWTCGCWTPVDQETCQYLPAPPPSVEQGPSSPPPTENCNCSWTPGYWSWHETTETVAARYVWRPGCWMTYNPDWLWVPPRYVSTACGHLFVQGYWDYPIERRGILYAPIYCPRTPQPDFVYCPSVCVSTTTITSCLFVQPRSQSYCFGDYFDSRYSSTGIYPWYAFHNSRYGCDPIYTHCAATHFGDLTWSRTLHEEYRYRCENPSARPPRIYNESATTLRQTATSGKFSNLALTMPLHQLSSHQNLPFRMTQVSANQRQTFAQSGKQLHQFASNRRTEEIGAAKHPQRNPSQPMHVKLPLSPIASRSGRSGTTVGHQGGTTVGHQGGSAVGHQGGTTVGHQGGSTVGHQGGSTVGHQGGSTVGHQGGSTVGHQGGTTVGHQGGSAVGHQGGTTVGHQGGMTVGHQGGTTVGHQGGTTVGHQGGTTVGHQGGTTVGHQGGMTVGHQGGTTVGHQGGTTVGHQGGHPTAQTTGKAPPPHPSYPQADHRVQVPPANYSPSRPEPHHNLPPREHRNPGQPRPDSPGAPRGNQQPSTINRPGPGASPPTGAGRGQIR